MSINTTTHEVAERSIREKLIALKRLQETLTSIDKIKLLRGELPQAIEDLADEIEGLKTRLEKYNAAAKKLTQSVGGENQKIATANDRLEQLKGHLDTVSNNREYEHLSREIEFQELEIQLAQKHIREFNAELQSRKDDIAKLQEREEDHQAKSDELDRIIAETRIEEEQLRDRANELEAQIDERILKAFLRLRKGATNGLAVVPVEREACGGCFNHIPPQRQLEVKLHNKIIVCEYCGRVLIDPDIEEEPVETASAETTTEETSKEKATKKTSTTKKATTKKATTTKKASTTKKKAAE